MSNHDFDVYSLQRYLAGLEKPNEDEVVKALMELQPIRTREIIIKHLYEKKTFDVIGKEYRISRQRVHQLFSLGIEKIRKALEVK